MKNLPTWLAIFLLILTSQVAAQSSGTAASSLTSRSALPGAAVEFLPVEEAYQLTPRISDLRLLLEWQIAPGYYLYRDQFGATLTDSEGNSTPLPLSFEDGVQVYDEYYEKDVVVYYHSTTVTSADIAAGGVVTVALTSQGCADAGLCYPPRSQFLEVNVDTGTIVEIASPPPDTTSSSPPQGEPTATSSIYLIMLFAIVGGVILNLMPCVFPVLSIKVLSLSTNSLASSRHHHGLAYTAGVISTFLVIALVLIILRAGGEALGWGFQMQSPLFITFLIYLFFVMGLSFSGFYEAGARLMNMGQSVTSGHGLRQSYFTGVLASVVASPCTAPFMGAAIGAALSQSTPVALVIFASLGFGMALPFLVLSWAPALAARLPRPGPWMETFKQILAYPLYFTSVWLLWVLGRQAGSDAIAAVLTGLLLVTFAIWIVKKSSPLRLGAAVLALIAALAITTLVQPPSHKPIWEPYTEKRLAQLREQNRPVFVNLTADWCITCLANEKVALNSSAFAETLQQEGIVYLKGDWTNYNAEITALLNANGRSGVPLYLFYARGADSAVILPQILTPGVVIDVLTGP